MGMAIKPEGEGVQGLNGPAIKRRTFFCGFPYPHCEQVHFKSFVYASAGTGFKISSNNTM